MIRIRVAALLGAAAFLCGQALADTRILFVGLDNAGSFEVRMWVPFGATSDVAPGTAHLMEHLKFKSSQEQGLQHIQGIAGASENAETSYNSTRFDIGVPGQSLKDALLALNGVSEPLSVTPKQLDTEKVIVTQELLQRTTADPDYPKLLGTLLKLYKGSELERRPSGTEESINAITMKDVQDFDAAHYAKTDKFLMIAGPVIPDDVQKRIVDLFPHAIVGTMHIDKDRNATRSDAQLLALPPFLHVLHGPEITPMRIQEAFSSSHVKTEKVFYTKLVKGPTTWNNAIAAKLIEEAVRSRLPEGLHDHIADDAGLVQDYGFDVTPLADGIWQITLSGGLVAGVAPEQVTKVFEEYLSNFATNGISTTSLERLKKRHFLNSEWEDAESRIKSIGFEATNYGYAHSMEGRDDLKKATPEDIALLLKVLAGPGRIGITVLKPEGAQ